MYIYIYTNIYVYIYTCSTPIARTKSVPVSVTTTTSQPTLPEVMYISASPISGIRPGVLGDDSMSWVMVVLKEGSDEPLSDDASTTVRGRRRLVKEVCNVAMVVDDVYWFCGGMGSSWHYDINFVIMYTLS